MTVRSASENTLHRGLGLGLNVILGWMSFAYSGYDLLKFKGRHSINTLNRNHDQGKDQTYANKMT